MSSLLKITCLSIIALLITACGSKSSSDSPQINQVSALNVPINVNEALPGNVLVGFDRFNEPVKVGVPLLDSDDINSVDNLRLDGVSESQFRVLDRYDSGNIKWVLVDFQTDLVANKNKIIYLKDDGVYNPQNLLGSETPSEILIDTGSLTAVIKKDGKNIIDQLITNGFEYISRGNDGQLILEGNDSIIYSSKFNDLENRTVIIEENGPLRSVVKINGVFRSSLGESKMRYGLRLHFYKDKSYFRAFLTVMNDMKADSKNIPLNGVEWVLDTNLNTNPTFKFEGQSGGVVSGNLDENVYLLQGFSLFRSPYEYDSSLLKSDYGVKWNVNDGYMINKSNTILKNFSGDDQDYANGYAQVDDLGNRVSLIYRGMSGYWSSGFDLNPDGSFSIDVLSRKKNGDYLFSFFAHETRELLISFGNENTASYLENTLNYPVFGLPAFEQIRDTGAIWGQKRLPTEHQVTNYYHGPGGVPTYSSPNPREDSGTPANGIFSRIGPNRKPSTSDGGLGGNAKHYTDYLMKALMTNKGGYYLISTYSSDSLCDSSIANSYDSDLPANFDLATGGFDFFAMNGIGSKRKAYLEHGHPHWLYTVPWYYLTGDERIKECIPQIAKHRKDRRWKTKDEYISSGNNVHQVRPYAYGIRDVFLENYLVNIDNDNLTYTKFVLENLVYSENHGQREQQNLSGWNNERGYFYGGHWTLCGCNPDHKNFHTFFVSEKLGENMVMVYNLFSELITDSKAIKNKLRDRILGLADFTHNEISPPVGDAGTSNYFMWYDYDLAGPHHSQLRQYAASHHPAIFSFGYERTKDPAYLDEGVEVIIESGDLGANHRYVSPEALRFIFDYVYQDKIKVGYPDLTVINNGDGSYDLSWTPPQNVDVGEYVLKYSEKEIVESLNFDNVGRTYEFDPSLNIPFWSADEPEFGPFKTDSSYIITGLNPLKTYNFKLKYLNQFAVDGVLGNDSGQALDFTGPNIVYSTPSSSPSTLH